MVDYHQTVWLCSMPRHHMRSQHAVFPADRWLLSVPSRGQRARSCLFSSYVCNCWQWRRELAAAGQSPTWCIICFSAQLRSGLAAASEHVPHVHISYSVLLIPLRQHKFLVFKRWPEFVGTSKNIGGRVAANCCPYTVCCTYLGLCL